MDVSLLVPPDCLAHVSIVVAGLYCVIGAVFSGFSQLLDDPPVTFEKKVELTVSNPAKITRNNEPIIIPIAELCEKAPDFNKKFFRVKHKTTHFEPLDIPSQIRTVPGKTGGKEELVFQLDLGPGETVTVDLQYNPDGSDLPDYPPRTQSFKSWYRDGSNSAWENEIIGYRYYFGMIDYFGKSYPGLCLDRLQSDSYHHERLWGQDPYAVGKTPGLGGISLLDSDTMTKCFGYPDDTPSHTYIYDAHGGGPVCAGVVLRTEDRDSGDFLVDASTTLFHGRFENIVRATAAPGRLKNGVHIAPGMKKFENEHVTIDDEAGSMLAWGVPVEEYGTIGTSIIWHPDRCRGIYDVDDARYVRLEPDDEGFVDYKTLGVWYRASSDQPSGQEALFTLVKELAVGIQNPVSIVID
ncbi:DUF4861 family protein [Candidatus Latescibacterota bacterium]